MNKTLAMLPLATVLVVAPVAHADNYGYGGMGSSGGQYEPPPMQSQDYGEIIGNKAASGAANIVLGWIELPKNVINTSNEINLLLGVPGGLLKGTLHTVGRILAGTADLLTFPLPTQPIVHPQYVWQEFSTETRYGPIFKTK